MTNSSYIELPLGSRAVDWSRREDGAILMRSREPLEDYPRVLTDRLVETAREHPDRVLLSERGPDGRWEALTYGAAIVQVRAIGQALLDRGLSEERPLVIMSAGSVAHALMVLAATHVGVPHAPVTPAYSLLAQTFEKLDHVLGLLTPGLIFVEDAAEFARALQGSKARGVEVVARRNAAPGQVDFETLRSTLPSAAVERAHEAIRPDDTNKVLFTSGSMGMPKGVVNTHRMVNSNQQMFLQSIPSIAAEPPMLLSWLPWHHTSGANMILGMVVYSGGTLYIDDGKPVPGLMDRTIANLRDVSPSAYFSAPSGFKELIHHLERDDALRQRFFARLKFLYYSGASMPQSVIAAMDELAIRSVGARLPFFSNYGSTETAPFALAVNWPDSRSGLAGLPVPGVELKLALEDGRFEARLKGPSVTPGYWRQDEATRAAFDEEGFYRYGDVVSPLDPQDPAMGLVFEGRLGENFKLTTGTWVSVASLREKLVAGGEGLIRDAVITGEGQGEVGALIFLDPRNASAIAGLDQADDTDLASNAKVRTAVKQVLDGIARQATGSSTFVARALILGQPPDSAAGEVTDKGTVSQKVTLRNRADAVSALHGGTTSDILLADAGQAVPDRDRKQVK